MASKRKENTRQAEEKFEEEKSKMEKEIKDLTEENILLKEENDALVTKIENKSKLLKIYGEGVFKCN